MKKLLYFVFLFLALNSNAQQSIVYKVKYLPNHKYSSYLVTRSDFELNFNGDKQDIDVFPLKLKSANVLGEESHLLFVRNTGTEKNNLIPLKITFPVDSWKEFTDDKKEGVGIFFNKKLYTHTSKSGILQLDSIAGKNVKLEQMAIEWLKTIQSELQGKELQLKLGDTFVCKVPAKIILPIGITSVEEKITYKLVSIKNDMAYFDLILSVRFYLHLQRVDMSVEGVGEGKSVYDLNNFFITNTTSNLKLDFSIGTASDLLKGIVNVNTTNTTSIE
jgi:hypothetical protein